MSFYHYLLFGGGIVFALVIVIILISSRRGLVTANRLLAIAFASLAWFVAFHMLFRTQWLLNMPMALGWGDPFAYLIAPCCYLYVRMVLNDETRMRKRDFLHFIPFVIHLLDNLHIILMPVAEKQQWITEVMKDWSVLHRQSVTIIPLWAYFPIRMLLSIGYIVLQWRLLYNDKRWQSKNLSTRQVTVTRRWLWFFTSMLTVFFVAMLTMSIPLVISKGQSDVFEQGYISYYIVSVIFFAINVQFFFFPEILYGMPRVSLQTSFTSPAGMGMVPIPLSASLPHEQTAITEPAKKKELPVDKYKQLIEEYFSAEQPYLQPKFSVHQMSVGTGIPLHHLSYLLNNYYNKRFTDFVNEYRIQYVLDRIKEGALTELSVDGLSRKAGFSSRSNFSLTFKKHTGITPTEYLQRVS